jgi:hypothetical protein
MTGARISRDHLSDESLARCRKLLLSELTILSALAHRYQDNPEVVYELSRDDDALSDLLGILLGEIRGRRWDDAETAELTDPGSGG